MTNEKKYKTLNNLFILYCFLSIYPKLNCEVQISYKLKINILNTEVSIYNNNQKAGFLKIFSLFGCAILYDLFIIPEFRLKGNGTKLLDYSNKYLKKNNIKYIFIQPGPFEIDENNKVITINNQEQKEKVNQLIKLYKKVGFIPASNFIKKLASIYYTLSGIDENPNYLMIMKE